MSDDAVPNAGEPHESLWGKVWSYKMFRGAVVFSGLNTWYIGSVAHSQGVETVSLLALIIGFFLVYSGVLYTPIRKQKKVAT